MPTAQNGDIRLAYDISGSGPNLLLIAGTSADRAIWAQVRPVLAGRFRTIAFDNRDAGASSISSTAYSMNDLVEDTRAVLDAAGSRSAHVVGHSLGGIVGQEFALAHPRRTASLTLANSWARRDTCLTSVFELARDLSRTIDSEELRLRAIYFLALGVPALRTLPLTGLVGQVLAAGPAQPREAAVRQWQLDLDADTLDRLPGIAAPTHVIWSRDDRLVPSHHGGDLARAIPDAFETALDDVGHAPMIEDPAAFLAAMIRFFEAIGAVA